MQGNLNLIRCTEELVSHSIDCSASCIAIRLDHNRSSFQVVDNGKGIGETELRLLSSNNYPVNIFRSRNNTKAGLGNTPHSIALTIESQEKYSSKSYKRHYRNGIWSSLEVIGTRSTSGTTVTITDCLQFSQEEDKFKSQLLENGLKKILSGFFLLHPSISFSLRTDPYHSPLLLTKKVKTTICAAQQLFKLENTSNISPFCNSSRHFKLKGLIALTHEQLPAENFFVFVNSHLIESREIVDIVRNFLFKVTMRRHNLATIINIKCSRSLYEFTFECENIKRAKFSHWNELLSLIRNSLDRFDDHHSKPDSISGKVVKTALVSRWLSTIEGGASAVSEINCQNRENDSPQIEQRAENEAFTLAEGCTSQHLNEIFSGTPETHFGCLSVPNSSVLFGKALDSIHIPLLNPLPERHEIRIVEPQILIFQNTSFSNLPSPRHLASLWIDHEETSANNETDYPTVGDSNSDKQFEEVNFRKSGFFKQMNCKRRCVSNDEVVEFRSKKEKKNWDHLNKNSYNKFWFQPKLPPNIAFSSSDQLTLSLRKQCTFTKSVMGNMHVISQVDKKFIGCITQEKEKQYLLLIDQHAAHERVCLERLMKIHSTQGDNGYIQVQSSPLHPHLKLSLPFRDFEIIRKLSGELSRYGLQLQFNDDSTEVSVTSVPACFLAREINEIQRKRHSVYQDLTMALIEETISEFTKNGRLSACLLPVQIRNVLNSLACHGAIKFGDELSQIQCSQLIKALGQCDVPFQCAHGRPLLTPLFELGDLSQLGLTPIIKPNYSRLYNYSIH